MKKVTLSYGQLKDFTIIYLGNEIVKKDILTHKLGIRNSEKIVLGYICVEIENNKLTKYTYGFCVNSGLRKRFSIEYYKLIAIVFLQGTYNNLLYKYYNNVITNFVQKQIKE